jgi:hypothetical protein
MTPTVVKEGAFRLFFFSREETRIHVHVNHPDGEAKFWLEPVSVESIEHPEQFPLIEDAQPRGGIR